MKKIFGFLLFSFSLFAQDPQNINNVTQINWQATALPSVQVPLANQIGSSGNATYYYWVVANYASGNASPSAPVIAFNSSNVLNSTNYNKVSWNILPGATSYDILRTTVPFLPLSGTANIFLANVTSGTYLDQGASPTNYTVNTFAPSSSCNWSISATNVITLPCVNISGVGTITGVTPGNGLSGGGNTGTVTLNYTGGCISNPCTINQGGTNSTTQAGIVALTPNSSLYTYFVSGATEDVKISTQAAAIANGGTIYSAGGTWANCPTWGSIGFTLELLANTTVNVTCVIPKNVSISTNNNALLNTGASGLITINGNITVNPVQQMFTNPLGGGAGSVIISHQAVYVDWFGGDASDSVDSTQAIKNALASHLQGEVRLSSQLLSSYNGTYLVSSAITVSAQQFLVGETQTSSVIDCSPNTTTSPVSACVIAAYTGSNTNAGGGIRNVKIEGIHNGGTINTGLTCLYVGGDPNGVITPANYAGNHYVFENVQGVGCNYGVQYGNNTYLNKFDGGSFVGNNYGFEQLASAATQTGEITTLKGTGFNNNAIAGWDQNIGGNFDCSGCQFDFDGPSGGTGPAISGTGAGTFNCHSCNFEQLSGYLINIAPPGGVGIPWVFNLDNDRYGLDSTSAIAEPAAIISSTAGAEFIVNGGIATTGSGSHTVTTFISGISTMARAQILRLPVFSAGGFSGTIVNQVYFYGQTGNCITMGSVGSITNTSCGTSGVISGFYFPTLLTQTNCSSSASPAVCGSAASGNFVMAVGTTTIVVNTTAVTANSQIQITEDTSLGTKLGVTCNTTDSIAIDVGRVTARTAGTSFTVSVTGPIATNPACYSYSILN